MEAETRTRKLARTIRNFQDLGMRAGYLRRALEDMGPSQAAKVFALSVSGAEARDPDHGRLLQGLSLALSDETCEELRAAIRKQLVAGDQLAFAALLTPPEQGESEDDDAQQVPDFGVGRPLALGERKSLARRLDRNLIARVLRDPHPDVIRIVLLNPTLTEADVVRLSAKRPVRAEVLREVFRSPRWIVRYPVKLAIALNPHAPIDVRLQLVPHLTPQDAERIVQGGNVPASLEAACERMTARELH